MPFKWSSTTTVAVIVVLVCCLALISSLQTGKRVVAGVQRNVLNQPYDKAVNYLRGLVGDNALSEIVVVKQGTSESLQMSENGFYLVVDDSGIVRDIPDGPTLMHGGVVRRFT